MAISANKFYPNPDNGSRLLSPSSSGFTKTKDKAYQSLQVYAKKYCYVRVEPFPKMNQRKTSGFDSPKSKPLFRHLGALTDTNSLRKSSWRKNETFNRVSSSISKPISYSYHQDDGIDFLSDNLIKKPMSNVKGLLFDKDLIKRPKPMSSLLLTATAEEEENVDSKEDLLLTENEENLVNRLSPGEEPLPVRKVDLSKPQGLNNLGNTCYINVVVQVLFTNKFFMEDLIKYYTEYQNISCESQNSEDIKQTAPILLSLIDLYENRARSNVAEWLRNFKHSIGQKLQCFNNRDQHDAAELLTLLLESVKEELDLMHMKSEDMPRNPIDRNFRFELLLEDACEPCLVYKRQSQKSISLHLSLTSDRNIQSAFLQWLQCETLESKCEKCHGNLVLNKYFNDLPKILCLQVQRYSETGVKDEMGITAPTFLFLPKKFLHKQEYLVSPISTPYKKSLSKFRETIVKDSHLVRKLIFEEPNESSNGLTQIDVNMEELVHDDFDVWSSDIPKVPDTVKKAASPLAGSGINENECERYQLVSVICHHGGNTTAGHYTSYVFNFENNSWFHCDDETVYQVDYEEMEKQILPVGYCYFYAHCNV